MLPSTTMAGGQPIPLTLDTGKANDLTIKDLGQGEYELTTKGPDPYIYTLPISAKDHKKSLSTLALDTFSLKKINNFQVFFGPPISEQHSVQGIISLLSDVG